MASQNSSNSGQGNNVQPNAGTPAPTQTGADNAGAEQVTRFGPANAAYNAAAFYATRADGKTPCVACGHLMAAGTSVQRGIGGTCIQVVSKYLQPNTVLVAPAPAGSTVATNLQVVQAIQQAKATISPLRINAAGVPVTSNNTSAEYGVPANTQYVTVKVLHWGMRANVPNTPQGAAQPAQPAMQGFSTLLALAIGGNRTWYPPFIGLKANWQPHYVNGQRYLHPSCNTVAAWAELQAAFNAGTIPAQQATNSQLPLIAKPKP